MNELPKMVESYGDAPRQRMSPMGDQRCQIPQHRQRAALIIFAALTRAREAAADPASSELAAIGYCFGGMVVLEMARDG
jgi:dienelactone hydrolase